MNGLAITGGALGPAHLAMAGSAMRSNFVTTPGVTPLDMMPGVLAAPTTASSFAPHHPYFARKPSPSTNSPARSADDTSFAVYSDAAAKAIIIGGKEFSGIDNFVFSESLKQLYRQARFTHFLALTAFALFCIPVALASDDSLLWIPIISVTMVYAISAIINRTYVKRSYNTKLLNQVLEKCEKGHSSDVAIINAIFDVTTPLSGYSKSHNYIKFLGMIQEAGERASNRTLCANRPVVLFRNILQAIINIGIDSATWYRSQLHNIAASMSPKLLSPYTKMASKSSAGAMVLAAIAEHNEIADSADFVKGIEINWHDDELDFDETLEAVRWLAQRENESIAHWLAQKVRERNVEAIKIAEDVLSDDVPKAFRDIFDSYEICVGNASYRTPKKIYIAESSAAEAVQEAAYAEAEVPPKTSNTA